MAMLQSSKCEKQMPEFCLLKYMDKDLLVKQNFRSSQLLLQEHPDITTTAFQECLSSFIYIIASLHVPDIYT